MSDRRPRREFRRQSFACVRDWVHFIVEFDLLPCSSCRRHARVRHGAPEAWRCSGCSAAAPTGIVPALPLHPDLWQALREGRETAVECRICRARAPLSRCWISEDGRELYCAAHLRPIAASDRLRRAGEHWVRDPAAADGLPAERPLLLLAAHLRGDRCGRCPFNGRAVYDGDRLVEVDRDRRRCTSTPDALNCAGIDH